MYRSLSILFFSFFYLASQAAHIVGGDMYYDCLGNNDYRITLKVYRDCNASGPNVAWFDEPAFIAIYDASGSLLFTENVFLDFHDAEVTWDASRSIFVGRLLKAAGKNYPVGYSLTIGCFISGDYVVTHTLLPK